MYCKLCWKYPTDQTNLIDLYSTEAKILQILEIIQKHVSILEIDPNVHHTYTICSNCCQILCNFHELYLTVESALEVTKIRESDSFAEVLYEEFKFEHDIVKLEPNNIDCINTESPQPAPENPNKRPSEHFNTQNVQTVPSLHTQHEVSLQLENRIVKDEITTEAEVEALNDANDNDFEQRISLDSEEYENEYFSVESASSMVQKRITHQNKRSICKTGSRKSSPSVLEKYNQSLRSHVTENPDEFLSKNFELTCCVCHITLEDFSSLLKHFCSEHNIRGYATCCKKKFSKRCHLVDHVQTHLNPAFFKCSVCDKVAADRHCLDVHMQTHEKKPERTLQCATCLKRFFSRPIFMRHLQLHIPEEERKAKCPQCEKTFPTTNIMGQHFKVVHLNVYSKICDICGKFIRGREALRLHQQDHAGVIKTLVECELCGSKFRNKYGLSRHIKTAHSEKNSMPQMCTICSRVSPTVSAHREHIKYMHKLERKHACPVCDKVFKTTKDLRVHMITHTGEALYKCTYCPKRFCSSSGMYSHRRRVHHKELEANFKQRCRFVVLADSNATVRPNF